jgi:hypothetical protein
VGPSLTLIGGFGEFAWGVNAEGRSLEAIATPLSVRAVIAGAERGLTGGLTSHVRRGLPPGERVARHARRE